MPLRKFVLLLFVFFPLSAFAAVNATMQWDVQTTGSATNGGGFDPSVVSPGTDESQGSGTSVSCTVQATTTQVICIPAISATTHGPGNVIGPMTGSGCTTSAWLEILSQSSGTATLSSSAGSAASVCTGTLGGSLADYKNITVASGAVTANTIWIQSGTYTYTTTPSVSAISVQFEGYGSTHGDFGTPPLITTATNSTTLFSGGGNQSYLFSNINFSNTAATRSTGFVATNQMDYFYGCTLTGFNPGTTAGTIYLVNSKITASGGVSINAPVSVFVFNSSVVNSTGGAAAIQTTGGAAQVTIVNSIISGNTGIGINLSTANRTVPLVLLNNTIANNTSDGLKIFGFTSGSGTYGTTDIEGNIFYGNGGYGVNSAVPTVQPMPNMLNAYGANSTAARNGWPAGTGDITLTANPFTNSGTGDYSLNNTAGGGAALRTHGYPGTFTGGTPVGYLDIGAVQHQDTGGTGASNYGFAR